MFSRSFSFWMGNLLGFFLIWFQSWPLSLLVGGLILRAPKMGALGVSAGLVLGVGAHHSLWEEIQSRPGFAMIQCESFYRGRVLAPHALGDKVRTPYLCPVESRLVYFGPWELSRSFEWRLSREGSLRRIEGRSSGGYEWRSWVAGGLVNGWPLQTGLRKALLLGDGSSLPARFWGTMNSLGLSHLLVASGMHLLVFAIWSRRLLSLSLGRILRPGRHLLFVSRITLALGVGLWAVLLGFDLSIARAWWTWLALNLFAPTIPILGRFHPATLLALCGLIFFWLNPKSLFDPTYSLTFGTTWVLIRTGSVLMTGCMATLILGVMGLNASLWGAIFNWILALPTMVTISSVSLIGLAFPSLASTAEQILEDLFVGFRFLTQLFPDVNLPHWAYVTCLGALVWLCTKQRKPNSKTLF